MAMDSGSSSSSAAHQSNPINEEEDREQSNTIINEEEDRERSKKFIEERAREFSEDPMDTYHLTEPIEVLDPDDSSTFDFFLRSQRIVATKLFDTLLDNLRPGENIYGMPVFELYSIEIHLLDKMRYFSMIYMMSSSARYVPIVIYKRPQGEKVPLHKPLPLKNLFRPPSALYTVYIGLSNPGNGGWLFHHSPLHLGEDDIKYELSNEVVKDEATDSEALISYELIKSAAIAKVVFQFLDGGNKQSHIPILIMGGTISATNDGNPRTKRLIQRFSHTNVFTNQELPVDRSIFAVPMGSNLEVQVELKYRYRDGTEGPYFMTGSLTFQVPTKTSSEELYITANAADRSMKLFVKVYWSDCLW